MGCPVNSIKEFERHLLYSRSSKFAIIILANAETDSSAADFVFRNFHTMDVISDDIDFYMPGYGVNKYNLRLTDNRYGNIVEQKEWIENSSQYEFADFHAKERRSASVFGLLDRSTLTKCCKIIHSPRLGEILFNIAEFTDFVMEFTRRKPGYHYLGGCQLIIVPSDEYHKPQYANASVCDLDLVIDSPHGPSLDSFLFRTFDIIRRSIRYADNNSGTSVLKKLFGRNKNLDVISEIDNLYREATRRYNTEEKYEIVVNNIIIDMNRCLHWDITEEQFYFISYSSRNVMQAEMLKRTLQMKNIKVWIAPDGIPQGREYPVIIPTALKLAKIFLLLLTPQSAKSEWVRRELAIAINNSANTKIKVLLAEGFTIDDIRADNELEFLLDRVQIKYGYDEVIHNDNRLLDFIHE